MSTLIALVAGVAVLRVILCIRQLQSISVAGAAGAYASAQTRLRLVHGLVQALLIAVLGISLQAAGPAQYWRFAIGVVIVLSCLDLIFAAYRQFVIDARFGFNRLGAVRFLGEAVLDLVLRAGLAWFAAPAALALFQWTPGWWWLPFVVIASLGARLAIGWLYPRFIQSRLEQQSLLTTGSLAERLRACLNRCGFADAQLVMACGSNRSSHANARAEEVGLRRRVVLLDTLEARLDPAQIEAVVAHELGHLALRHHRLRFALLTLFWLLAVAISAFVAARAFPGPDWRQLIAVLLLAPQLRFLLQPLLMLNLRRWEFQADAFAAGHQYAMPLLQALEVLFKVNAAAPAWDSWFAFFYVSHPPLAERRQRLCPG